MFEEDYVKLFGRAVEGMDVEITVWAVNATTPAEAVTPISPEPGGAAAASIGDRTLFDPALGKEVTGTVIDRTAMATGATVQGPAAITEDETTIILPSSRHAVRQPDGCIDVRVQG